jgi:hypothetical protein
MDGVIRYIAQTCSNVGPLHRPLGGPPPRSGEELGRDDELRGSR